MRSPFAQPEKSRVATVTTAKSRVLAAQVLRILSRKGFGTAKPIANPTAYLKDDPAKEPLAASYSAPGVIAEAAHKTGRVKGDFEIREISKEEFERIYRLPSTIQREMHRADC
jgi:hypothetical protein